MSHPGLDGSIEIVHIDPAQILPAPLVKDTAEKISPVIGVHTPRLNNRTFGAGYQFVPPMSVTLGIKECLSAKKVRVYSDTGSWKQTALRVALFGPITPEYPLTLLQKHPDARITATIDTAVHPISENPDWDLL